MIVRLQELDIKELAHAKNVTVKKISKRTGIAHQTLKNYCRDSKLYYLESHGIMTNRLYEILSVLDMVLVAMDRTEYENLLRMKSEVQR